MGYTYMVTCITDFILFPVLWSILHAYTGKDADPWSPLTLQGAGLYHLAMGAVLGIAAWTRGNEKVAAINSRSAYSTFEIEDNNSVAQNSPRAFAKRPIQEDHPIL